MLSMKTSLSIASSLLVAWLTITTMTMTTHAFQSSSPTTMGSLLFRRSSSASTSSYSNNLQFQKNHNKQRYQFFLSLLQQRQHLQQHPQQQSAGRLNSSKQQQQKTSNNNRVVSTGTPKLLETLAQSVSQTAAVKVAQSKGVDEIEQDRIRVNLVTLSRVAIPSLITGVVAFLVFPGLAMGLATLCNDAGVFTVLSTDSSQFVQNFLTVAGLLFSILVGQTYYFMYQQQESVYYALFNEVTEAKSLLEQVALVCQGRAMYPRCLDAIYRYVQEDLKKLGSDPAVLLSARPVDDPLESIMYMTSVGVPSTVYETVRSLRQARAARLGALQRKLPTVHMGLLWILAAIELVSFPLLGAGTQTIGGYRLLTIEGILFGVMTSGIVLTLRVVGELWRPAGGAYNVDYVLSVMVRGLLEELQARMAGMSATTQTTTSDGKPMDKNPSPP